MSESYRQDAKLILKETWISLRKKVQKNEFDLEMLGYIVKIIENLGILDKSYSQELHDIIVLFLHNISETELQPSLIEILEAMRQSTNFEREEHVQLHEMWSIEFYEIAQTKIRNLELVDEYIISVYEKLYSFPGLLEYIYIHKYKRDITSWSAYITRKAKYGFDNLHRLVHAGIPGHGRELQHLIKNLSFKVLKALFDNGMFQFPDIDSFIQLLTIPRFDYLIMFKMYINQDPEIVNNTTFVRMFIEYTLDNIERYVYSMGVRRYNIKDAKRIIDEVFDTILYRTYENIPILLKFAQELDSLITSSSNYVEKVQERIDLLHHRQIFDVEEISFTPGLPSITDKEMLRKLNRACAGQDIDVDIDYLFDWVEKFVDFPIRNKDDICEALPIIKEKFSHYSQMKPGLPRIDDSKMIENLSRVCDGEDIDIDIYELLDWTKKFVDFPIENNNDICQALSIIREKLSRREIYNPVPTRRPVRVGMGERARRAESHYRFSDICDKIHNKEELSEENEIRIREYAYNIGLDERAFTMTLDEICDWLLE